MTQAVVIADALDALDRRELWRSISDGYERLAERPDEWQEYVEERNAWIEAPLTDTDR